MPHILLPNLMFEDDLQGSRRVMTASARRIVAELGPVMGLLSGHAEGEECIVLVAPEAIPGQLPPSLDHVRFETLKSLCSSPPPGAVFRPWGWSRQAIQTGRTLNLGFEAPDPEVVRLVNSRQFSAEFDMCFPLASEVSPEPFGVICSSMEDVRQSLKSFDDRDVTKWVIKANLSQAARNRLIGNGPLPDEPQRAWLQQRFLANEAVYAEPWVERLAECGLQFTVKSEKNGDVRAEFDGAAEMLTDAVGRYRGSILRGNVDDAWWQPAIAHCRIIAQRAAAMGFFGVMGMDCMLFLHPTDGSPWLRVCHDINGRCTMGRIALSLGRYIHEGETGIWCHAAEKFPTQSRNLFDSVDSDNVRIVHTSPSRIGSQPVKLQTALLISDDCRCLTRVAGRILSQNVREPFSSL